MYINILRARFNRFLYRGYLTFAKKLRKKKRLISSMYTQYTKNIYIFKNIYIDIYMWLQPNIIQFKYYNLGKYQKRFSPPLTTGHCKQKKIIIKSFSVKFEAIF